MDVPPVTAPTGTDEGQAVAAARKARRLTQADLARQAAISLSLLRKIEQGDRVLTDAVRAAIARVLGPLPSAGGGLARTGRISAAIPLLQDTMDCYDLPSPLPGAPRPLPELRSAVTRATQCRLASRYAELADLLPGLIRELTTVAMSSSGHQQEQAYSLLALAYRAADAIADKHGYRDMSARAVELTRWAAARSGDPILTMMAAYVRAELFFAGSRPEAGLQLLDRAAGPPPPEDDVRALATYGAIQMRAAVLAARAAMPEQAADRMAEARVAASHTRDGTYAGTAFGPSSVRVHELAAAVEAGNGCRALQLASDWEPPATLPAERRSHFHIEAARAYHWAGKPDQAINALWQARQAAPQHTRWNAAAARTVQALVQARRHPPAPLLQFAAWMDLT
jgi:transcriptional regulator with XRE-family HTH domain